MLLPAGRLYRDTATQAYLGRRIPRQGSYRGRNGVHTTKNPEGKVQGAAEQRRTHFGAVSETLFLTPRVSIFFQAGYPSAKPSLLSTDDALTRYLGTSLTEGVYHAVPPPHLHDVCTASWKGTKLLYVQIYKVNTNGICANLMKMSDGSATNRVFGFTFVREPLGRFSSGFSEISWRTARDGKKGDKVCSQ